MSVEDIPTSGARQYSAFLIDDHPIVRLGLTQMIETQPDLRVCGEIGAREGAVEAVLAAKPDVILLDLNLPDASGMDLIKEIRGAGVQSPILVISLHEELQYAERAIKAGANGFLMKHHSIKNCLQAIRKVINSGSYLSEAMTNRLVESIADGRKKSTDPVDSLTSREFEVFDLIGRGRSTRQISEALRINSRTVDVHRSNIKTKLGVRDAAELAHFAVCWVESQTSGLPVPFRPLPERGEENS